MALGSCLFWNCAAFENKKYTSYDRFHGNGPYGKILTKKEPIRTLGFTPILPCHIIILPHFDYCSPVWNCMSGYLSDKLQKLQNRTAGVITKSLFDTSSNLLLAMLKWEKLTLRRKKQKALIMYKTLNELAPEYLQCLFTQRHVNDYNWRNLEGKLSLPKPNTNYFSETKLLL